MEIKISFQTWDSSDPVIYSLSPEEYFDPIQPHENFEEDGISKYPETWEYLLKERNLERRLLKWSMEKRTGTHHDTTFRTQYMDNGRSWMTHRSDPNGYEEITHYTQLTESSCHIFRTFKTEGGSWAVHVNCVIEDRKDGSQTEHSYLEPWSYGEAIKFTRLGVISDAGSLNH